MEYTYQPGVEAAGARFFAKARNPGDNAASYNTASNKAGEKEGAQSEALVKEVMLGRSPLARFGYWLLMRNAGATRPLPVGSGKEKKTKVTRSDLRQNSKPVDLLSIVSASGRKSIVRVTHGKLRRSPSNADVSSRSTDATESISETVPESPGRQRAEDSPSLAKNPAHRRAGVSSTKVANNKISGDHVKYFEQDLFVKTERNIAAAMKEARTGISAEQLVVRFGLSVPEAGLIASMHK